MKKQIKMLTLFFKMHDAMSRKQIKIISIWIICILPENLFEIQIHLQFSPHSSRWILVEHHILGDSYLVFDTFKSSKQTYPHQISHITVQEK